MPETWITGRGVPEAPIECPLALAAWPDSFLSRYQREYQSVEPLRMALSRGSAFGLRPRGWRINRADALAHIDPANGPVGRNFTPAIFCKILLIRRTYGHTREDAGDFAHRSRQLGADRRDDCAASFWRPCGYSERGGAQR